MIPKVCNFSDSLSHRRAHRIHVSYHTAVGAVTLVIDSESGREGGGERQRERERAAVQVTRLVMEKTTGDVRRPGVR